MNIEDKIRIFLTDQTRSRSGSNNVLDISKQIMIAVSPFYKKPSKAETFRKEYGFTDLHNTGWDSGGFQFLMGKLKMKDSIKLPCGIEVPASAQPTIDLYKNVGIKKTDYPIQLDLPPRYDQSPEMRKQLIVKSTEYYYQMAEQIPSVIPTVHGWDLKEMQYNLDLLHNPEKAEVAIGSFVGASKTWTMQHMNPHKPKSVVSVGSNKALHNSENYLPYTNNHANKHRNKIVVGPKKRRVSFKIIMERIATALNLLKDDYDVFMLGGASPHMVHQVFLAGASWTDTSAWRIKALMAEVYLGDHSSGHTSFAIGYSRKNKYMDDEGKGILKAYLLESNHPYSGMTVDRFLAIGRMNMTEWRKTWPDNQWEVKPFLLRALHNAWMLKHVVEPKARDFASDPDRYYRYMKKFLAPRKILSKRLDKLWSLLQQPYVQTDLQVYLKGQRPTKRKHK